MKVRIGAKGFVKTYFIESKNGFIMVDTGISVKMAKYSFKNADVRPEEVTHLIITHAHQDHTGGITAVKELCNAEIIAHRSAVFALQNGINESLAVHSFTGKIINLMMPKARITPVDPDIVIDEEFDLNAVGVSGKLIHTPGHTAGSISVILDSGEAIIGDMLHGRGSRLSYGIWYEDSEILLKSLKKISSCNPEIIYLSHSGTVSGRDLKRFLQKSEN